MDKDSKDAKRSRGSEGDNDGPPAALSQDDLEQFRLQLMGDVNASINKSISEFGNTFAPKVFAATTDLVKKLDQKTETRFSIIEKDLNDLHRSFEKLQHVQGEQRQALQEAERVLAIAETAPPTRANIDLTDFERQVDVCILRVNTAGPVTTVEVNRVLRPWLLEADCDESKAEITSPDVGQRFVIRFKGPPGIAERFLRKAHQLLRDQRGVWRTFEPNIAAGGGSTRAYVDFDKNGCQQKRERDGKRLRQSLQQLYADKNIRFNRNDGLFSYLGAPLARMDPQNDDQPSRIQWNLPAVVNAQIDRDAILADYRARAPARATAANVTWTQSG